MDIIKIKYSGYCSGLESHNEGSWSKTNTPSSMARTMFYYVQSMGHFFCNSNYVVDRSNYDTMLLLYTCTGKGVLKYQDKSYELSKGCIFIIDCMDYQYYATSDDSNM